MPEPADIGIVFEVADSNLRTDRREKGRLYAQAGIAVHWVLNVPDGQIEVYNKPDPSATPPTYTNRTDDHLGQVVPLVLDGAAVGSIPVAELLP